MMEILILHPDPLDSEAHRLADGLVKRGHNVVVCSHKDKIPFEKFDVIYAMGSTNVPPGIKPPIVVNGDNARWKDKQGLVRWLAYFGEKLQIKYGCFSAVLAKQEDALEFELEYGIPVDVVDPQEKEYFHKMHRVLKEAI